LPEFVNDNEGTLYGGKGFARGLVRLLSFSQLTITYDEKSGRYCGIEKNSSEKGSSRCPRFINIYG